MAAEPTSTTVHSLGDLVALRRFLWRELERRGCSQNDGEAVILAAHEAAKNGLRYSGERPVYITLHFALDRVVVCVADCGQGFDYSRWQGSPPPGAHRPSGRGLHLMQQLMDQVEVAGQPFGCVVRMRKRLALDSAADE